MATTVPGQTTSAVVGSTYQAPSATAEAYMYKELDRKRREQEERNAQIRAEQAAQQQAAKDAADQEKVKAAFNQTYGPQLQRAYQSNAVQSAPTNTAAGKMRDWGIGHGFTTGGTAGQPGSDYIARAAQELPMSPGAGGIAPQAAMSQKQLQDTLGWMWSQKTDPYQRAANNMNTMRMFYGTQLMPSSGRSEGGGGGMLTR